MGAKKSGQIGNMKANPTSTTTGLMNWKDATKKFRLHEKSESHCEAVENHVHQKEKMDNRAKLLQTIRSIRYISRQGLALRGHKDSESNFLELLKHHSESDSSILSWIEKKQDKFTAPQIQNELLQIMALKILRKVSTSVLESNFFSLMVDETTDVSNREQVVLVL